MHNINHNNLYNIFYDNINIFYKNCENHIKNFTLVEDKIITIASCSLFFVSASHLIYSYLKPQIKIGPKILIPTQTEKLEMLKSGELSIPKSIQFVQELGDKITRISLDGATPEELAYILSACPKLETLNVTNSLITKEAIAVLSNTVWMCVFKNCDTRDYIDNLPSLKCLFFTNCKNLSYYQLPSSLSQIVFSRSKITEDVAKNLPNQLSRLDFYSCDLTKITTELLPNQLTSLEIHQCTNLHHSLGNLLLEKGFKMEITESDVENISLTPLHLQQALKLKNSHNIFTENELIPFIDSYKPIMTKSLAIFVRVTGVDQNKIFPLIDTFFTQCYANAFKNEWKAPAFNTHVNQKIAWKKIQSRPKDPVHKMQKILLKKLALTGTTHQLRIQAWEEAGNPKRKPSDVCKKIKKGELVIIASGSKDHAINLVFYHSFMAICNRGVGYKDAGTTMQVTPINPTKFTEDLYAKIVEFFPLTDWEKNSHSRFFYKDLPEMLKSSKKNYAKRKKTAGQIQTAYESHKPQKVGNCIAASPKLANRACLALLNFKINRSLHKKIVTQIKQLSKCESYLMRRYAEDLCFLTSRANEFCEDDRNAIDFIIEISAKKRASMSKQYYLDPS